MDSSLIATKFQIPPPTQRLLHRTHLVDALERAVRDYKLMLITAPAGYGKTALLAQWARSSRANVVWLTADPDDNDRDRFFRYLLAAWAKVQPHIRESPLGLLLGAAEPDFDKIMLALVSAASAAPECTIFVFDDIHLIEDAAIHNALIFLLDHLPPTLHVALIGRGPPPLPLARYRARQEMFELGADDLRFSDDETRAFLNQRHGLDLNQSELDALQRELEGWAAGLQLASLTLRGSQGPAGRPLPSGRHRFIADYLKEDVLGQLPDPTQRFLLQTSFLDHLCGALCDAVTGRADGQELLEALERDNVFLVPLDDRRAWFRYHHLFADFLQDELTRRGEDDPYTLHRRAARWYLEHDLPEPAFHHAVQGDDPELAVQLLDRYESFLLHSGQLTVLQGWLGSIPAVWFAAHPELDLCRAGILAFTGALDACVRCVDDIEQKLESGDSGQKKLQLARVTAFRCYLACFQNDLPLAETYAREALRALPVDDHSWRADIYHALGETYRGHGLWQQARDHYLKAMQFSTAPEDRVRSAHVFGALADLDLRQGRLRDAAAYWNKALQAVQDPENWGRLPLPVIGWVYLRMGELLYQRNELAAARDHLKDGLQRAELGGDVRTMIAGYVMVSRLALTEGDVEAAAVHLERARPLVDQAAFPDWTSRFERGQLDLWLAQGNLRAAADWAAQMLRDETIEMQPERESRRLALARALIAGGDARSWSRALEVIDRLRHEAEAEGRAGVHIEALALRALGRWRAGERAEALIDLEHALRLAEPEGYVRLFADLGLPMTRLLQEAQTRNVMPEYVATLLGAFTAGDAREYGAPGALPELLSEREREVLGLMAAGLSNREIGDQLFISAETVKKHSGSIYAKLAVARRTEAIARARELGILSDAR